MMTPVATAATTAYDVLAGSYDTYTADYDYNRWLTVLHDLATQHGARGRRLRDVACPTGRSFEPMLRPRLSGQRVRHLTRDRQARGRTPRPSGGACAVADMRALPDWGTSSPTGRRSSSPTASATPGLDCVAVRGQATGAVLNARPDERIRPKIVFIARRPAHRADHKPKRRTR